MKIADGAAVTASIATDCRNGELDCKAAPVRVPMRPGDQTGILELPPLTEP